MSTIVPPQSAAVQKPQQQLPPNQQNQQNKKNPPNQNNPQQKPKKPKSNAPNSYPLRLKMGKENLFMTRFPGAIDFEKHFKLTNPQEEKIVMRRKTILDQEMTLGAVTEQDLAAEKKREEIKDPKKFEEWLAASKKKSERKFRKHNENKWIIEKKNKNHPEEISTSIIEVCFFFQKIQKNQFLKKKK